MPRGTVKWFNDNKGYGFIQHGGGRDVYVHFSAIESDGFRTLTEGDSVEFDMRETAEGPKATHVMRAH